MDFIKLSGGTTGITEFFRDRHIDGVGSYTNGGLCEFYRSEPYALKFTADGPQTISLNTNKNALTFQYSYDRKNWTNWDKSYLPTYEKEYEDPDDPDSEYTITQINKYVYQTLFLNQGAFGSSVYIRGNNTVGFTVPRSSYANSGLPTTFVFGNDTSPVVVEGNAMSLMDYENTSNITLPYTNSGDWRTFAYLFSNCVALENASGLILPSTSLTPYAYEGMFSGCFNLRYGPELPATAFDSSGGGDGGAVYGNMFLDCRNLLGGPSVLPATSANSRPNGDGPYMGMFYNCSSLTESPIIRLDALGMGACAEMFWYCKKLEKITLLATSVYQEGANKNSYFYNSLYQFFSQANISANGLFVKSPNMPIGTCSPSNSRKSCLRQSNSASSDIPYGWTVVDYAG